MKKTIPLLALLLLSIASGCATRTYTRTAADGTTLEVRSKSFMTWGRLSGFSATDKGVSVGSHEGGTEAEKLQPLIEAVASGVAQGVVASLKGP